MPLLAVDQGARVHNHRLAALDDERVQVEQPDRRRLHELGDYVRPFADSVRRDREIGTDDIVDGHWLSLFWPLGYPRQVCIMTRGDRSV